MSHPSKSVNTLFVLQAKTMKAKKAAGRRWWKADVSCFKAAQIKDGRPSASDRQLLSSHSSGLPGSADEPMQEAWLLRWVDRWWKAASEWQEELV